MQQEKFLNDAKAEQEKWINPVGRLILAAGSIERSVNEILEVLSPEDKKSWSTEEFSRRVWMISVLAKANLSGDLITLLKDQKRKYWPVMANRNAIAHNPLFFMSFASGDVMNLRAKIFHEQKEKEYELADIQKFADEADAVAAELMEFAMDFPAMVKEDKDIRTLFTAMHMQIK